MSDATATAAAAEVEAGAEAEVEELREQTWRVLRLDPNTVPAVTRWLELEPMSGAGKYGYKPDASELGELHGVGRYLLVDSTPEQTFRTAFELEVGSDPNYYDVQGRAELERWRAERDAEAAAEAERADG